MLGGCQLQTYPHRLERDVCCDAHGGTCAWLGAKVIPICCDGYLAQECAVQAGSGG